MELIKKDGQFIISGIVECFYCYGTGLYKGFAEGGKSAVVCNQCEGKGRIKIEKTYTEFKDRKMKKDVNRVYKTAGGFGITDIDIKNDKGELVRFSIFGVSYDDWLKGKEPLPIMDLHCPLQHYKQGNGIYEKCCKGHLLAGDYIPKCPNRASMSNCWKKFMGEK